MTVQPTQVPVLIEGVRLRLRRSTPADAPACYAMVSDPELMRFMDWPMPKALAETQAHFDGCPTRWNAGTEYHWMIERKPAGEAVGSIACRVKGHAADFGCFVGRAHWRQGVATEAATLLVGWLRRQRGLVRIWATCDTENTASAAVLRKAGLQPEGVLRRATVRPNLGPQPRDTAVYACIHDARTEP